MEKRPPRLVYTGAPCSALAVLRLFLRGPGEVTKAAVGETLPQ